MAVKVDNKCKNVSNVKAKVWSFKCIKWAQECINKSKNIAINVQDKAKSSLKPVDVSHVTARKSYKRRKPFKFQSKKVHLTIIQLLCQEKETKFLTQWLVIWFWLFNKKNINCLQERVLICSWKKILLWLKHLLDLNSHWLIWMVINTQFTPKRVKFSQTKQKKSSVD